MRRIRSCNHAVNHCKVANVENPSGLWKSGDLELEKGNLKQSGSDVGRRDAHIRVSGTTGDDFERVREG